MRFAATMMICLTSLSTLYGDEAAIKPPAPNRVDEPIASFSASKAAEFLDSASLHWQKTHQCFTCHTNYAYLMARPVLGKDANAMKQVRGFAEELIQQRWKTKGPRWDAEVVATGSILAINDANTTGKLHPLTKQALDKMWTVQRPDGGWNWLKCEWPPMESDDHYGATLAAIGVGMAPDQYAKSPEPQAGMAKLKKYFAEQPPRFPHHRAMLLWANAKVPDLVTTGDKQKWVDELLSLQKSDGGWNSATLGTWKRHDGKTQDTDTSDGYATGFVVFVLRQAGILADDARIQRGVNWLKTHQRESGRWYARSLFKDSKHYLSHAASAFAVMALAECNALDPSAAKEPMRLPRSTPEAQGISSAAILQFVEEADKKIDVMNSFMLVRHGHVVAEGWWGPYDAKTRHELYSLSKSFTSTAVGMAVAEGKLSIDDPVLKFFPEDAPAEPSNNLKSMRVRDLLCMSTGHQSEPQLAGSSQPWVKTFLAHAVPHKPGTHFLYNTPATYMQSAIVQKVTGKTVLEYLQPRLFEPLGIEDPTWGKSPQGVSLGGYGLNVRTEDIAKFGQLYLQKGKWGSRQLLPAAWVEQATARQTSNGSNPKSDWDQGYGYQFWRSRHGAYRGDGAFGQYCLVLPEQDAVVVITSGVKDMQAVLNLVWDKLLPEMKNASLSPDSAAHDKLQQKLASLAVPTVMSSSSIAIPEHVYGKNYVIPANDQKLEAVGLELNKPENQVKFVTKCTGKEQKLACGNSVWSKSRYAYGLFPEQEVAACGAWTSSDTYTVKICFYETPFILTLNLNFTENKLKLDGQRNVGFGTTKQKQLVGEAK